MLKKITLILVFQFLIGLQLVAQHTSVELSYLSLRPFIHFQLDFGSHGYDAYDSYESSYVNGYMDGVNKSRHYLYDRFHPYWYEEAYEAGYRDGFRDHKLYVRLRGYSSYSRHRFNRHDYHSPYYSVRVWLDGLSVAFLKAPAYKLPNRWEYHAHPDVKKHRRYMAKSHRKGYSGAHTYTYQKPGRIYKSRSYRSRKEAHYHKQKKYKRKSHHHAKSDNYFNRKQHVNNSGRADRVSQKRVKPKRDVIRQGRSRYQTPDKRRVTVRDKKHSRKSGHENSEIKKNRKRNL